MSRIAEEMIKACEEGVFPGAALLVAKGEEILFRSFFGNATLIPAKEPVTETTLFDIASLTKPVATASLALLTVKEKGLPLNAPVSRYLENFTEEDKKKITVRHLLKHTSGLPAWRPYYEDLGREHPESVGKRTSRTYYLDKLAAESLEMPVSYQRLYSDLGFILLGFFLETMWDLPLDELFQEKMAAPLGMNDTFFVPIGTHSRPVTAFAATEDSPWRKKLIRGEVHDDNAYALGGVAGHAGLFSTVDDLHRFLCLVAYAYEHHENALFPREILTDFIGPKVKVKLGWDTPSPENSQAGKYFSKTSIGHLGYSGCSFWLDPEQGFHIILLTNRVHPTSKNEKIKEFRPQIHDIIYEKLLRS